MKNLLLEMSYLGYSPGTIRSLSEINKLVDMPVGKTSNITVKKVVKQGVILDPIMWTQYKRQWNISMVKQK